MDEVECSVHFTSSAYLSPNYGHSSASGRKEIYTLIGERQDKIVSPFLLLAAPCHLLLPFSARLEEHLFKSRIKPGRNFPEMISLMSQPVDGILSHFKRSLSLYFSISHFAPLSGSQKKGIRPHYRILGRSS